MVTGALTVVRNAPFERVQGALSVAFVLSCLLCPPPCVLWLVCIASAAYDLLKINQCDHIFVEDCDIHGGGDTSVDFVGTQYSHVHGCRVHDANDWCGEGCWPTLAALSISSVHSRA